MQQVHCFYLEIINFRWKRQKFICFLTLGLFTWKVIWPLLWPVFTAEHRWYPENRLGSSQWFVGLCKIMYSVSHLSKLTDFSPFSIEGFERATSKSAKAKLLHFCGCCLLKRLNVCLRNQMQSKTTVCISVTHKEGELGLQIFLISKWCISASIYAGFHKALQTEGGSGGEKHKMKEWSRREKLCMKGGHQQRN